MPCGGEQERSAASLAMCGKDCIPALDGTDLAVGITDKRGDSRRDIGGYSRCAGLYVALMQNPLLDAEV